MTFSETEQLWESLRLQIERGLPGTGVNQEREYITPNTRLFQLSLECDVLGHHNINQGDNSRCGYRMVREPSSSTMQAISIMYVIVAIAVGMVVVVDAFTAVSTTKPSVAQRTTSITQSYSTASSLVSLRAESGGSSDDDLILHLELVKPLGLILEENDAPEGDSASCGVYVKDVGDAGSAVQYASKLIGATITKINDEVVTSADFDTVMDLLIAADETLTLQFELSATKPVGTPIQLTIQQADGTTSVLEAKVGENLRQTLIDNDVPVYMGMKEKLGNCGGGGQCGYCAYEFLETGRGWEDVSEYETTKVGKFSKEDVRLTCLNPLQDSATIRKLKR